MVKINGFSETPISGEALNRLVPEKNRWVLRHFRENSLRGREITRAEVGVGETGEEKGVSGELGFEDFGVEAAEMVD